MEKGSDKNIQDKNGLLAIDWIDTDQYLLREEIKIMLRNKHWDIMNIKRKLRSQLFPIGFICFLDMFYFMLVVFLLPAWNDYTVFTLTVIFGSITGMTWGFLQMFNSGDIVKPK